MVCSDHLEAADITPSATKPDAGTDFIEGIREGLEDFAEGRYEVFDLMLISFWLGYLKIPDIFSIWPFLWYLFCISGMLPQIFTGNRSGFFGFNNRGHAGLQ